MKKRFITVMSIAVVLIFGVVILLSKVDFTDDPGSGKENQEWSDKDKELLESLQKQSFGAECIRTNGGDEEAEYPVVKLIRSVEELQAYYEANKENYNLDASFGSHVSFWNTCQKYDAAYFENQILVMVLVEEGSGSIRHQVTSVGISDKTMVVEIERLEPDEGTCDMAEWHILIEPEAGVSVESEADIKVFIDGRNMTDKPTRVSHKEGFAGITLDIAKGWEYEIIQERDTSVFMVNFWPEGHADGVIGVEYFADRFGVCGTGLKEEEIKLGQYEARMGTYDNQEVWNFIYLLGVAGDYAIMNKGADKWWKEYGDEAMQILCTLTVGNDTITEAEAIEIAKAKANIEYDEISTSFDIDTGIWTVHLYKRNTAGGDMTIEINADGNIIDLLWGEENDDSAKNKLVSFQAVVQKVYDGGVLVYLSGKDEELIGSDQVTFGTKELADIGAKVGDIVEITCFNYVMESYPAQIVATDWKMIAYTVDE